MITLNRQEVTNVLLKLGIAVKSIQIVQANFYDWAANYYQKIPLENYANLHCLILLLDKKRSCIKRSTDLLLIVGADSDLWSAEFINALYETLESTQRASILQFFEKKWQANSSKFPAFFYLTVNENDFNCQIHISYRAIAPAYRHKKAMREISLYLLRSIKSSLGSNAYLTEVTSITNHPATYKFFNPQDKYLHDYREGEFQNVKLELLLKQYDHIKEENEDLHSTSAYSGKFYLENMALFANPLPKYKKFTGVGLNQRQDELQRGKLALSLKQYDNTIGETKEYIPAAATLGYKSYLEKMASFASASPKYRKFTAIGLNRGYSSSK